MSVYLLASEYSVLTFLSDSTPWRSSLTSSRMCTMPMTAAFWPGAM